MLVVSNIDLKINGKILKPSEFLKSSIKEDCILNISNDYRYMKIGYYVSLHAETLGSTVIPPTENILDAYRTPIMLIKAAKANIPIPPNIVAGSVKQIISELSFPVVIFPVNPVSVGVFRIAHNRAALYRAFKSLTMNYKYAVCAMPFYGEIISCKSFFGKCTIDDADVAEIARKIYKELQIPICNLL
ncbi:RimK-like ATPgrasp N-terminal domain-containing protein, partial [Candidatus Bathyarchaeota archaeon]|nr:RimK-like ATPgrasp N-terminal domain-containing protein [Candidatus Bathyarchaeota archaeon]